MCGADLPPDVGFCASCGAPAHPAGPTVEHRLVTALYVDLVGSTGLAETLDAEDLTTLVRAVQDTVQREVEARGGSVGAFVGDGVLGVFGLPVAHDDDPERALGAAVAVLDRVGELRDTLGVRFGVELSARVGVNTGDLLAPAGSDPDLGTLAGDVLNVAARLQEMAEPGTIIAAERSARSAPRFRFEDRGLADVRGRARPVHVFGVVGGSGAATSRLTAPLHGRLDESRRLREAYLTTVAEGRPRSLVVVGTAGVGKSRIVREFTDWASASDNSLTTLSGRCLPYGQDVTYRPLSEVIAELTGVTPTTAASTAADIIGDTLARHVTTADLSAAIEAVLRMIGLDALEGSSPLSPRRVREVLRSTWRSLLSGLAEDGPVVLVIEDIHWAGDALLELLGHVVARGDGPLLVVATARPEIADRHLKGVRPGATTTITLGPLPPPQASRLAAHLLAATGLPVANAEHITGRADGNPFFIEELVREMSLRRDDDGHETMDELPATIQGVVSARIDLLDPPDRRVLQAGSIVGRIFWPSAVEAITGLTGTALDETLDRLEALQLVRVDLRSTMPDEPEYIFQHVLIREAAYGRLSRPDLAAMHSAAATWFEARATDRPDAVEQLAFHTYRAHEAAVAAADFSGNEVDRLRHLAVARLIGSTIRSRERAAFGRSRQIAETALGIAQGPAERALIHEQLGLTHLARYDGDAAWTALREAVLLHLQATEPDHDAIARTAASAVETPMRWQGTMHQLPPMEDVLETIQIGIQHAGSDDSESLASLLIGLAFAPTTPGPQGALARSVFSIDEGRAAGERAREMAGRLGLRHLESAALDVLQHHALWSGRIQEASAITGERLEIVDAIDDPSEVGDTYAMAASLSFDLGDYELARDRALHGYGRTIDEAPNVALHTLSWAAVARVQTGEWEAVTGALAEAGRLLDPTRKTSPPIYAAPIYAAAALVAEFQGRSTEADHLLAILNDVWASSDWARRGGHPHARWVRHTGPIYIRRGDFDTAGLLIASDDAQRIGREGDRLAVTCDLVAAAEAWSDADGVIQEARAAASAYGLAAVQAHADRLEGRASAATGDAKGGLALLTAAHERFDSLGDRWEAARTALDIEELGVDVGLDAITGFFTGLGAIAETERARRLIDRRPQVAQ